MLGRWASKLVKAYAKTFYYITIIMGLAPFSIRCGKLQLAGRKLVWYSRLVCLFGIACVCAMLVSTLRRLPVIMFQLGVEFYLPAFLYVLAATLMVVHIKTMQIFCPFRVLRLVQQLLTLRQQTEQIMGRIAVFEHRSIFAAYHFKVFLLFSAIVVQKVTSMLVISVLGLIEEFTWVGFIRGNMSSLYYDLFPTIFSAMYTLGLLLFDAICQRLQEVCVHTLNSQHVRNRVMQQLSRGYLLDLYAWSVQCNRLCASALFLYYAMLFVEILADFYSVFTGFYGGVSASPSNYAFLLLKLLAPYLMNIIAEHACQAFRNAIVAVEQICYGRIGRMMAVEHLLVLHEKQIAFGSGKLFRLNRVLTLAFYAEIASYIITLVQFNMENK